MRTVLRRMLVIALTAMVVAGSALVVTTGVNAAAIGSGQAPRAAGATGGRIGVVARIDVGQTPTGLAVDPANHRVYVSNENEDTISVIDDRTNTVIKTIDTDTFPFAVAVDPTINRVYALGPYSVTVIDTQTDAVVRYITVQDNDPVAMAVDSSTHEVFVSERGHVDDPETAPALVGFDPMTGAITQYYSLFVGQCLAADPGTHTVYGCGDDPRLIMIDEDTEQVSDAATISGSGPAHLTLDTVTHILYVTRQRKVLEIDTRTNKVVRSFPDDSPFQVAVDSGSGVAYVEDYRRATGSYYLDVVGAGADGVTQRFVLSGSPAGIDVEPATGTAYVADPDSNTVTAVRVPPRPTVEAVSPSSGPVSGGQQVTISGTNLSGATNVTFGTTAASFHVDSDSSVTATAPPHTAATVQVRVIRPGGVSLATAADHYTYATG